MPRPLALLALLIALPAFADIRNALQRAATAYSNGRPRQALAILDDVLYKNPWHREALLLKGLCFEALGDDGKAADAWLEALRQDPAFLPALHRLAALRLRRNQNDKAAELYRTILAREPLDLDARLGLAEALLKRKMFTDTERELKEAERLAPSSARVQFLLGELALARQDRTEALRRFRKAKNLDPEFPAVYDRLARFHEETGDTNTAGLYLDRANALAPDDPSTYTTLASFHMRNRQWDKARAALERGRDRFGENALFHYNLAVLYDKSLRLDDALRSVETALRLDSSDPYAHLFRFFRVKDSNDRDRQRRLAAEHFAKARAYAKDGNHPEALVWFRKGLMLDPEAAQARYDYAWSLRRLGWERSWLRELAVAVELDPRNPDWSFMLEKETRRIAMRMKGLERTEPPVTETRILVLPLDQPASAEYHLDAGTLVAKELVLHLNNHPRLLATLAQDPRAWTEEARRHDYVLRGRLRETPSSLRLDIELLNAHDLQRLRAYTEAFQNNDRVDTAVRNLTRKLAADIPFRGVVFALDNPRLLVNLGSAHGLKPSDRLLVYRPANPAERFHPSAENTLGELRIVDLYEDFLVAEAVQRDLWKRIRLNDTVTLPPQKTPQQTGTGQRRRGR